MAKSNPPKPEPKQDIEIREILKDFLDETDYVLEAPIEQADDTDWYDRPYKQATQAIQNLIAEAVIEELKKVRLDYGHMRAETFAGGSQQSIEDRIKQLEKK